MKPQRKKMPRRVYGPKNFKPKVGLMLAWWVLCWWMFSDTVESAPVPGPFIPYITYLPLWWVVSQFLPSTNATYLPIKQAMGADTHSFSISAREEGKLAFNKIGETSYAMSSVRVLIPINVTGTLDMVERVESGLDAWDTTNSHAHINRMFNSRTTVDFVAALREDLQDIKRRVSNIRSMHRPLHRGAQKNRRKRFVFTAVFLIASAIVAIGTVSGIYAAGEVKRVKAQAIRTDKVVKNNNQHINMLHANVKALEADLKKTKVTLRSEAVLALVQIQTNQIRTILNNQEEILATAVEGHVSAAPQVHNGLPTVRNDFHHDRVRIRPDRIYSRRAARHDHECVVLYANPDATARKDPRPPRLTNRAAGRVGTRGQIQRTEVRRTRSVQENRRRFRL
jgi:hypothetical protein